MLLELIGDYKTITLIGICKNAGKTTTICKVIEEFSNEIIGLTSVGRDGETTDLVTGTMKPEIYLKSGTLFATARGMLSLCDTTIEVVDITPYRTPFGEISVFRALSDGYVQIAGPSSVSQLKLVSEIFENQGASRILIDGAASRKSLAGAGEDTCAIFCVGASMDKNMDKTIAETAHICSLFGSEKLENDKILQLIDQDERFALISQECEKLEIPLDDLGNPNFAKFDNKPSFLWVSGAVTTKIITDIYKKGLPLKIITQDATHLLSDKNSTENFMRRYGQFFVIRKIPIVAVSANPWSAYGAHYDPIDFINLLRKNINIPVINVREGLDETY